MTTFRAVFVSSALWMMGISGANAQERNTEPMQIALRRLTGEQEAYFAAHGAYAASLDSLRGTRAPSSGTSSSVQIKILAGNAKGWAASATHSSAPRKSCVIVVGESNVEPKTLGGRSATPRGAVVCDE